MVELPVDAGVDLRVGADVGVGAGERGERKPGRTWESFFPAEDRSISRCCSSAGTWTMTKVWLLIR
jgi:hypothetical protein